MGKLFVISGPSGVGKTTLVNAVIASLEKRLSLKRVVTYTTKLPRSGDVPGVDYHFVSRDEFESKIHEGQFLEWSMAYENYYGSPRSILDDLPRGLSYIMILDLNGAESVLKAWPEAVLIWIAPKSIETLKQRLLARNTENEAQIARRLSLAIDEIEREQRQGLFDYKIENEALCEAIDRLRAIIEIELSI